MQAASTRTDLVVQAAQLLMSRSCRLSLKYCFQAWWFGRVKRRITKNRIEAVLGGKMRGLVSTSLRAWAMCTTEARNIRTAAVSLIASVVPSTHSFLQRTFFEWRTAITQMTVMKRVVGRSSRRPASTRCELAMKALRSYVGYIRRVQAVGMCNCASSPTI